MAAALVRRGAHSEEGTVHPTDLARDLYQIAELIEICFAPNLDSSGRASISEMKLQSKLGPLLWLLDQAEQVLGLRRGFVYRIGRRVVGNVSLFPGGKHPSLGRGWLIANVAVHPDYQRHGIARSLMRASMNLIRRARGRWAGLQVEENNIPAVSLYKSTGFETFETLSQWELDREIYGLPVLDTSAVWAPHRWWPQDAPAELDLIFNRARRGAMAWTQPIQERKVRHTPLSNLVEASSRERWVLPDPARPDRLVASMWINQTGWRRSQLTYYLDPALHDPHARQLLLRHVLGLPAVKGRSLRLETLAHDEPVDSMLRSLGFRQTRVLTQMRYEFADL